MYDSSSLILDAGPLIALFSAQDQDHALCRAGFEQLASQNATLRIPMPVLFEVYKWLLYHISYPEAQQALSVMQDSLEIDPITASDFAEITQLVRSLQNWCGSLEDASIVIIAQQHQSPVWTLNYRDLGLFKTLQFWIPD